MYFISFSFKHSGDKRTIFLVDTDKDLRCQNTYNFFMEWGELVSLTQRILNFNKKLNLNSMDLCQFGQFVNLVPIFTDGSYVSEGG